MLGVSLFPIDRSDVRPRPHHHPRVYDPRGRSLPSAGLCQSVLHQWAFYFGWKGGMQMRVSMVNMIFAKSLRIRLDTLSDRNAGALVNLMSTDVER